ncbi:MAG TPA: hypothetical protein VKQ70_08335, partial [Caulobacteraceae bacterium]|nr:hypothetical protein [Caulobacteraceae bacterium]
PAGGAQVRLNVQKFEIGLSLDNEKVDTTDEFQQAIRKDVGQMVLDHEIDGSGNLTSKKVDYLKPVVASSKEILNDIGKQINSSFDLVATPQPGNTMQPGQTWQAKRELPAPIIGDTKPLVMDVTYTFRGVRQHNGHQVAVIELRGDAKDATQSGGMRGTVLIDPTTGMVLQAKAIAETKQIVILRQGRGRLSSYEAIGTLEIKLQRGPGIN